MRTIIELPEDQLDALADVCRREAISRAEAIRQAVAMYLGARRAADASPAFGVWRDRSIDGLAYERDLRDEWDRGTRPVRRPGARR